MLERPYVKKTKMTCVKFLIDTDGPMSEIRPKTSRFKRRPVHTCGTYICWDDDEIDYNYYALQDLRRPAYTLSGDRTQKQIDLAGVSV